MIWQLPYSKETQYMIDSVCSEILGHLGGGKKQNKTKYQSKKWRGSGKWWVQHNIKETFWNQIDHKMVTHKLEKKNHKIFRTIYSICRYVWHYEYVFVHACITLLSSSSPSSKPYSFSGVMIRCLSLMLTTNLHFLIPSFFLLVCPIDIGIF